MPDVGAHQRFFNSEFYKNKVVLFRAYFDYINNKYTQKECVLGYVAHFMNSYESWENWG